MDFVGDRVTPGSPGILGSAGDQDSAGIQRRVAFLGIQREVGTLGIAGFLVLLEVERADILGTAALQDSQVIVGILPQAATLDSVANLASLGTQAIPGILDGQDSRGTLGIRQPALRATQDFVEVEPRVTQVIQERVPADSQGSVVNPGTRGFVGFRGIQDSRGRQGRVGILGIVEREHRGSAASQGFQDQAGILGTAVNPGTRVRVYRVILGTLGKLERLLPVVILGTAG